MRIFPGDPLIADRSIKPTDGRIVVARILGEIIVRRLVMCGKAGPAGKKKALGFLAKALFLLVGPLGLEPRTKGL